jgi:hypothetical protein
MKEPPRHRHRDHRCRAGARGTPAPRVPEPLARRLGVAQLPAALGGQLRNGRHGLDWAREAVEHVVSGQADPSPGDGILVDDPAQVTLLAPILRPPGIACFTTWPSHIADSVVNRFNVRWPDPDGELRAYCKQPGVGQPQEMEFGLGLLRGRDDQDGGDVLGPWLVTRDEVGPVAELTMSVHVNGEEWSSYRAGEMAWGFADLLSYLSRGQTVRAGHVLTSGCFPGGSALDLRRTLRCGDQVSLRVTRLGALDNPVGARADG